MFAAQTQADLFGAQPVADDRPDPEKVRARLHAVLAKARAAPAVPWKPADVACYRTVFPQMTNWLPGDEARQLRLEFEAELARLTVA